MKINLFSLTVLLLVWTFLLSWCCNKNDHSEAKQFCLGNWWTYSVVTSSDEEYGECLFPSWVGCRDEILFTEECNFTPDISSIDTEKKRLAGCEDNVNDWVKDFENWENISIEWWDESESWASYTRNWVAHYIKDWANRKINAECVADFVDWSISVTYGEAEAEGWFVDNVEVSANSGESLEEVPQDSI